METLCPEPVSVLEPVAGAAGHEDGDGRTEDGTGASTVGTARWLLAVSGLAGPLRPSSALLGRSLVHWAWHRPLCRVQSCPLQRPGRSGPHLGPPWPSQLIPPAPCAAMRPPPTSPPARYQVHYRHPCAPLSIPVAAGLQSALTAYSHPLHPPRSDLHAHYALHLHRTAPGTLNCSFCFFLHVPCFAFPFFPFLCFSSFFVERLVGLGAG